MKLIEKFNTTTKRKLTINDHFEVSVGRLLLVSFITLFQFLGLWCGNNWVLTPEMFFLVSNAILALEKQTSENEE